MVKVSVIVLNYKQAKLTIDCVKSVLKQTYKDFEILIIENYSGDGSYEKFRKAFAVEKRIRVFSTGANLGYTGGNNFGVGKAEGGYVVILNNDTLVEPDWLEELITGLETSPDVAMVSSNVINVNSFDEIGKAGELVKNRKYGALNPLGYYINFTERNNERFLPAAAAHGGSFIFRKPVIGDTPFDDDYFIYAEETKLAWITRLKGYKILAAPDSYVYHLENIVRKSSKSFNKYFTFLGERNKVLNWITLFQPLTTIKLAPVFLFSILMLNFFEPRKIPYRLKSYFWLLMHPSFVMKKRREIAAIRKFSDKELFKEMSAGFQDESKVRNRFLKKFLRATNSISRAYFKIMRLPAADL